MMKPPCLCPNQGAMRADPKASSADDALRAAATAYATGTNPIAYLPNFRRVASDDLGDVLDGVDGSQPYFQIGANVAGQCGELLLALSYFRPRRVRGNIIAGPDEEMFFDVAPTDSVSPVSPFTLTAGTVADTSKLLGTTVSYRIVRYAARTRAIKIDALATLDEGARSYLYVQIVNAATSVLRTVRGVVATGAAPDLLGLEDAAFPKIVIAPTGTFDADARSMIMAVNASGGGAGEGADCIIGGPLSIQKLMSTAPGQTGLSGFAFDPRSRRRVPHFMGLPCYRIPTSETAIATGGRLWAANLGPTGLQMLSMYGSPDTFGLALEETSLGTETGAREWTVMGAFALTALENTAVAELTGFSLVAPL